MLAPLLITLVLAQAAPASGVGSGADPYVQVQKAQALVDRGDFQGALAIADDLLKRFPTSYSSQLLRGMALDGLGRFDDAEESYQSVLHEKPKDAQTLFLLGTHYLKREKWDPAIACFEQRLAEGAEDAETQFYLAQAYFHSLHKGKALEAIERAAVLAPHNATILLKLGEYRAKARKFSPALEALLAAQKANPKEPGLDLALGLVYLSLLDVVNAREALQRAEKETPDDLAVISNLAETYELARDHAAAREYYQKLIDRGQKEARTYLGLGKALVGLGEDKAAIEPLTKAVELDPKMPETHFHLARAYRAAGLMDESKRELKIFSALKEHPFGPFDGRPELEQQLWQKVQDLVRAGKEKEARDLLNSGGAPNEIQPSYLIGALYYLMRRYADAERLLNEQIQLDPTMTKVRAYLGLAYLEDGKLEDAERVLDKEMEINGRDPIALMAMGKVQFAKKSWADALNLLTESRIVVPDVVLMRCQALLELGKREQALEAAQLFLTVAVDDKDWLARGQSLFARFNLDVPPEIPPAHAPTSP